MAIRGARCCIATLSASLCLVVPLQAEKEEAVPRLQLTVSETAGIRRFGYPVHTTLNLPRDVASGHRFRLLADGKPVAAQFRAVSGKARAVALDFNVSLGPLEKKTYSVEYGPKVEAGPEPKAGLKLEEDKGSVVVRSGSMAYVVPRDLSGLLRQVKDGKKEYTRDGSAGLSFVADAARIPVGGKDVKFRINRQGPLCVALHFQSMGKGPAWQVEMTFPRSKSWVEVVWTIDDKAAGVESMTADLNLLVQEPPALVDFGAGALVYTTLRKGESAVLRAGGKKTWETLVGPARALRPFVLPVPGSMSRAEGWAHLMDRQRCTAMAVADFAAAGWEDEIRTDGDGRVVLTRRLSEKAPRRLRLWLHFVNMPVQIGALTSPQAMQAPLVVEANGGR